MEFIYTVDPESEEPKMLIDKHIGFDPVDGMGIDGAAFARELMELDRLGKRRVEVWICSEGGSVMEGYKICTAMLNTKCKVDTYNGGMAASVAGVIFMCGRLRYMADYSIVMMHDPYGGDSNKALDSIKQSLITLISKRSGLGENTVRQIMSVESYIHLDEAVSLGICNELLPTDTANTGRLASMKNSLSLIINKINNQTKNNDSNMSDLKRINAQLNLHEEASPKATLEMIENLQKDHKSISNTLKTKDEEITNLKNELASVKNAKKDKDGDYDKMKAEYDALKKQCDELKEKMDKIEKDKVESEAKAKQAEFKDIANKLVKANIWKNDETELKKWEERFNKDPEAIKEAYSKELNKVKSATLPAATGSAKAAVDGRTVAAQKMAELQNKLNY